MATGVRNVGQLLPLISVYSSALKLCKPELNMFMIMARLSRERPRPRPAYGTVCCNIWKVMLVPNLRKKIDMK